MPAGDRIGPLRARSPPRQEAARGNARARGIRVLDGPPRGLGSGGTERSGGAAADPAGGPLPIPQGGRSPAEEGSKGAARRAYRPPPGAWGGGGGPSTPSCSIERTPAPNGWSTIRARAESSPFSCQSSQFVTK